MANTIDFNVNTNAVTVLNQTADAAENTAKGFTSAKAELRALNQQLLQMDSSSEEFKKASARAAELKDNIGDLSAEINANAGNAFEGLSNNVGLFSSRLMDLDLKGAGQALTAMGNAVGRIDFKTLQSEVGGLVKGLVNLAGAIVGNPLLALGGAVALLVVNFDKINAALNGTAEKVEKLGEANVALEKQNQILDARITKEKTLNGESFKTLELEKEKALNNVQVAENELSIAKKTGDINVIREKGNKLIEMRNLLSGITAKGEADRIKLIEEAKNLTIEGYKEDQARRAAIAKFEDGRAQQLAVIAEKQRLIKANLDKENLIMAEQQYTVERANFVEKDIETKKVLVQSDRQKQLQKELNDLLWEEQVLRNAKLAIATETTVQDLKQKDTETERVKTQFEEVKSLGLKRIAVTKDTSEKIFSQEDALNKRIIESQKKVEEHQKEILAKRVQMTSDAFGALSSLTMAFNAKSETAAKNQFKINKAFSLSQAIINTYQAVNAALTAGGNPAKLATGAQFVEAGIALTAGLANVIKIQQTQFGGANSAGGGGNLGGVGSGGGGTQAPSPANFAFVGNQPNQQQPPLQAYVVGTQVSSNLEAQQLIQNQSRLGG
jgi:hypothetical protein